MYSEFELVEIQKVTGNRHPRKVKPLSISSLKLCVISLLMFLQETEVQVGLP